MHLIFQKSNSWHIPKAFLFLQNFVLVAGGSYLRYLVGAPLIYLSAHLFWWSSPRARVVPYFCADGGWQEVGISVEYGPCFPPKELLSRVHSLTLHVPHKLLPYSRPYSQ